MSASVDQTCHVDGSLLPGVPLALYIISKHYNTQLNTYMAIMNPCYVVLLVAVVQLLPAVNSELVLVYSIQRHGARNVLPKSALLTEASAAGGPTLLPAGQQMCLLAGVNFVHVVVATVQPSLTSCM